MTSAPKSDNIVAAAGPAIQLAQSMTFRPAKRLSVMVMFPLSCAPRPWGAYCPAWSDAGCGALSPRLHAIEAAPDAGYRERCQPWRPAHHLCATDCIILR